MGPLAAGGTGCRGLAAGEAVLRPQSKATRPVRDAGKRPGWGSGRQPGQGHRTSVWAVRGPDLPAPRPWPRRRQTAAGPRSGAAPGGVGAAGREEGQVSRVPELPQLSPKRKQRDSRGNQLFINNFNFKKQSALVPFGGSRGFRPVGSAPSEGSRAGFPFILHVRAQPVGQRHHPRPPSCGHGPLTRTQSARAE